jgi:hypothetical protein
MSVSVLLSNRRTIFSPKNPLDISTVVSIYPKALRETKPTIFPGEFNIPKGSPEHPGVLVIGSSSWFREVNEDEPLLEIPVSSVIVADSIVKDWRNGILANSTVQNPGLFFLTGEWTPEKIVKDKKAELEVVIKQQRAWFAEQVKIADVLWARSNGNPLVISDDARLAAETLKLEKPWMQDFKSIEMSSCPACGALRNPLFPICGECKTIVNVEQFKKLGLQQAS